MAVHYPRSTTPVPKRHAKIAQEERAGSVGLISPLSDYHIFLTAFRGTPPPTDYCGKAIVMLSMFPMQ